jgi:hypothetical protein
LLSSLQELPKIVGVISVQGSSRSSCEILKSLSLETSFNLLIRAINFSPNLFEKEDPELGTVTLCKCWFPARFCLGTGDKVINVNVSPLARIADSQGVPSLGINLFGNEKALDTRGDLSQVANDREEVAVTKHSLLNIVGLNVFVEDLVIARTPDIFWALPLNYLSSLFDILGGYIGLADD